MKKTTQCEVFPKQVNKKNFQSPSSPTLFAPSNAPTIWGIGLEDYKLKEAEIYQVQFKNALQTEELTLANQSLVNRPDILLINNELNEMGMQILTCLVERSDAENYKKLCEKCLDNPLVISAINKRIEASANLVITALNNHYKEFLRYIDSLEILAHAIRHFQQAKKATILDAIYGRFDEIVKISRAIRKGMS